MRSLAFRRLADGAGKGVCEKKFVCVFQELASVDSGRAWHSACQTVYVCMWFSVYVCVAGGQVYGFVPPPPCSQESAL